MIERCCNSCGMLGCNKDNPKQVKGQLPWYSQENMDRLWENAQNSAQWLICHSTDPSAHEYEGAKGINAGKEMACVGFSLWIFMHLKIFEKYGVYAKYRNVVGHKIALPKQIMLAYAFDFLKGRTGLFGGMAIIRDLSEERQLHFPLGFEKTIAAFKEIMDFNLAEEWLQQNVKPARKPRSPRPLLSSR